MTGTGWAVTGTGAVASIGDGVADVFAALCAGRTGLGPLRGFDRSKFRAGHAYEIDDRPRRGHDLPMRATGWLCAAIDEALRGAGLSTELGPVPVLVGTGLRELRSVELWWRDGAELDQSDLHFGTALRRRYGACNTYTFANACSASLYALGLGIDMLSLGVADTVLVAGVDSITESMFGLLDRVHPEPPEAVRPFDRQRRGVLMGEGAVAVVLQRHAPAQRVLGRVRSVALNCDAYHVTAPDWKSVAAAMRAAYASAGIDPSQIDVVFAHGTGTLLNDEAEAIALADVFSAPTSRPLVTAIKSMTGHTSGGSGLLGVVVAAQALRAGLVPPIVGLSEPMEQAAGLRLVRGDAAAAELTIAQVNAFGFGGLNAVAIVEGGV
jgi:3-oxoacyl-[acyl-carrier-protein] synthase II